MNYKVEYFQTKENWLNSRGFGGSSASAILRKNPYKNLIDIYRQWNDPNYVAEDKDSECLKYGRDAEDLIRKIYALDMENKYKVHSPNGFEMYRRIDKPFMTATLDGILTDIESNEKGILEIKTHDIRSKADDEMWKTTLPDNYYIQVLHYLAVMSDYKFVVLVAKLRYFDYFNEGGKKLLKTEFRYYYIDRNEKQKEIDYLEQAETDFYNNYILTKVIPPIQL